MNISDTEQAAGTEELLHAAQPNLYRVNAFRVTGLLVDATAQDITRLRDRIKIMEKLRQAPAQTGGILPLEPPPDAQAISAAEQRLQDPERRLVDEFFWFWPLLPGQSQQDEALAVLRQGDIAKATEIWMQQSGSEVARHNLAVLSHAIALDLEQIAQARPLSKEEQQQCNIHWGSAFKFWKELLDQEGFWSRLTARIREFDDPRLTTGMARRIRDVLPRALLAINAQLAVRAAELGSVAETKQQVSRITSASFRQQAVDETLREAVNPIRQRLKTLCSTAEAEVGADPVHADQTTRRLLEQAQPLLDILDGVLPAGNPTRDGAHDEIALRVLSSQIAFGNKTENWKISQELLEFALPVAASESANARIKENLKIVRRNVESGGDWCGEGYYDLPAPVLDRLEQARELAKARRWDEAIAQLTDLLKGKSEVLIGENVRPLVSKTLAYCLHLRAVQVINAAVEHSNKPLPTIAKIIERMQHGKLDATTLLVAQTGETFGTRHLWCMACGWLIFPGITREAIRLSFKDVPSIICVPCSRKLDREQANRRRQTRQAVETATQDLVLAKGLDPSDQAIEEGLVSLREMASSLSVMLPKSITLLIRNGLATVADLVTGLRDQDAEVRKAAANTLRTMGIGATQAIPAVITALTDKVGSVRRAAKAALQAIDPNGTSQAVRDRLQAYRLAAKRRLLWWLSTVGPAALVLVGIITYITYTNFALFHAGDPSATYRLYSYGLINQNQAIPVLVMSLFDKNFSDEANIVLNKINPKWVASDAAKEAVPKLIMIVKDKDKPIFKRVLAAEYLGKIGPPAKAAIQTLIESIQDSFYYEMHSVAVKALRKIDPQWATLDAAKDVAPALMAMLDDKDYVVMSAVIDSLGNIRPTNKETVLALTKVLKDKEITVRKAAMDALRKIGPGAKEATPVLVAMLADKDSNTRKEVRKALNAINPEWVMSDAAKEAIHALKNALQANSVKLDAKPDALNEYIPVLKMALKNNDVLVRKTAAELLGMIGFGAGEAVPDLITTLSDPDRDVQLAVVETLGKISPAAKDAVPALIATLVNGPAEMQIAALNALIDTRDTRWTASNAAKEAVPALVAILKDKDNTTFVRQEAASSLGRIGPATGVMPVLLEIATQKNEIPILRLSAMSALGDIGPAAKETVPALEKIRKDKNTPTFIQQAAEEALATIRKR